jgi:hypothetical protein
MNNLWSNASNATEADPQSSSNVGQPTSTGSTNRPSGRTVRPPRSAGFDLSPFSQLSTFQGTPFKELTKGSILDEPLEPPVCAPFAMPTALRPGPGPRHVSNSTWHAFKRRTSSDEEDSDEERPPIKKCLTDQRMMDQMHRLSLDSTANRLTTSSNLFSAHSNAVPLPVDQIWKPEVVNESSDYKVTLPSTSASATVPLFGSENDNEDDDDQPFDLSQHCSLHFSDEMKRMMKTSDLVTRLAREELARSSQALILWEPPLEYAVASHPTTQSSQTSVVIEELPDDGDYESIEMEVISSAPNSQNHNSVTDPVYEDEDMDL